MMNSLKKFSINLIDYHIQVAQDFAFLHEYQDQCYAASLDPFDEMESETIAKSPQPSTSQVPKDNVTATAAAAATTTTSPKQQREPKSNKKHLSKSKKEAATIPGKDAPQTPKPNTTETTTYTESAKRDIMEKVGIRASSTLNAQAPSYVANESEASTTHAQPIGTYPIQQQQQQQFLSFPNYMNQVHQVQQGLFPFNGIQTGPPTNQHYQLPPFFPAWQPSPYFGSMIQPYSLYPPMGTQNNNG